MCFRQAPKAGAGSAFGAGSAAAAAAAQKRDEKSRQEGLRSAARQEYINLVHEYGKLLPAAVRSVKVTDVRDLEGEEREQYEKKRDKAYLDLPPPERFWTEAVRSRFPIFAKALPHVLTVPATSVACESLFSHANLVLGLKRHGLSDGTLATLTMLHYDKWSIVNNRHGGADSDQDD